MAEAARPSSAKRAPARAVPRLRQHGRLRTLGLESLGVHPANMVLSKRVLGEVSMLQCTFVCLAVSLLAATPLAELRTARATAVAGRAALAVAEPEPRAAARAARADLPGPPRGCFGTSVGRFGCASSVPRGQSCVKL